MKKTLFPIYLFIVLFVTVAHARSPEQQSFFSANSLSSGPQAVAFANDLSGIIMNPAGMYYVDDTQFLASFAVTHKREYVIHSATAFPLSVYKNIAIAINGAFIQTDHKRIQTGAAFGWRMAIFKAGLYGAYRATYEDDKIIPSIVFNIGFLITPAIVKAGFVIENRTTSTNTGFVIREQLGGKILNGKLKISFGAKQFFPGNFRFIPNIAAESILLDFIGINGCYEDHRAGVGITLFSFKSKLNFASSYDVANPSFDYAVSFDTRF